MGNILVTGGLGFIGSHLVTELLKDPADTVYVVDNLASNAIPVDDIVMLEKEEVDAVQTTASSIGTTAIVISLISILFIISF